MKDLIERLEKATGPDREIDADISRALGFEAMRGYPIGTDVDWIYVTPGNRNRRGWQRVPTFTESIDYALTLVPEGLDYMLRSLRNNAEAHVGGAKGEYMIKDGQHPVPAIALCIAALKARAISQTH